MQRFEEFDQSVLIVDREGIESSALNQGFAVMRFDGFSRGGELPVVHEGATLVVEAPKLAGNEFAVSREERVRSRRLVLVERLALRISGGFAGCADVMQFEIGIGGHHDNTPCGFSRGRGSSSLVRSTVSAGALTG